MSDWDRRIPRVEDDEPDMRPFFWICTIGGIVGAILLMWLCPTCC